MHNIKLKWSLCCKGPNNVNTKNRRIQKDWVGWVCLREMGGREGGIEKKEWERGRREREWENMLLVTWKLPYGVSLSKHFCRSTAGSFHPHTYLVYKPSVNALLPLYAYAFLSSPIFFSFSTRFSIGDNLAASMPTIISRQSLNHIFFLKNYPDF